MTVTFDSLKRTAAKRPTFRLDLNAGHLRIVKLAEDESYCYKVSLVMDGRVTHIGTGWFSGMGTGGDNDLIDFLNAYCKAFN